MDKSKRWGDYINAESLHDANAPIFTHLLSNQLLASVKVGLKEYDPSKPCRIGWVIEQGEQNSW